MSIAFLLYACVCVLCVIATRESRAWPEQRSALLSPSCVAHSAVRSARVLRPLLVERIKHGAATSWSLSYAQGGHLEQSLPHALQLDHFPLHLRDFRLGTLLDLFTGRLCVHAQQQQLSNLF